MKIAAIIAGVMLFTFLFFVLIYMLVVRANNVDENISNSLAPVVKEHASTEDSVPDTQTAFAPMPEELSLDKIFDYIIEQDVKDQAVVLVATGDYIPARSVNFMAIKNNDFTWPVKETAELTKNADITVVNLETPIFDNCPVTNEGFIFCGEDDHIEGMTLGGYDVVNLANNHAGNYELEGIEKTVEILEQNSMQHSGLDEIAYVTVGDTTFSFLGYNNVGIQPSPVSPANKNRMTEEITEAQSKSDVVVVSMSWGVEYTTDITDKQQELAYHAIDSGADLIIGNHTHWVQPVEIYKNKLITYAHGNYVFDQMWSEETKEGVIGSYYFIDGELVDVNYEPIYIVEYGKSTIPTSEKSEKILDGLKDTSYDLAKIRAREL